MQRIPKKRSIFLRFQRNWHSLVSWSEQPEQCLVVIGDVENEAVSMQAGDFEWMAGETIHNSLTTRGGCELLIIASLHDEVLA